jgi:hypothetical protein
MGIFRGGAASAAAEQTDRRRASEAKRVFMVGRIREPLTAVS